MRAFLRVPCTIAMLSACALPRFEQDPQAVAPEYDRWEAMVPAAADSAYAVALGVVLEAGYTVSVASRADRVITTNLRRLTAGSGFKASDHDLRFTVSVLAAGADSARVSVAGDSCFGRALSECVAVTAYSGGSVGTWQFVRRLGESVLDRIAQR